jgi:DHA3 family tetracycline resistance protein-like MFS transporter
VKKLPAYSIYLITQGSFWFFFTTFSTLSAVYRIQSAGLNPLQLILVGTVLEGVVFLFEIPTGIVADLYSRRLSVIIGYLLIGIGFMVEAAVPIFATILLAQIIWGIGATFTSGAEEAWLADEEGEENLAHIYLRGSQIGQAGTLVGIVASVALGRMALNLPIFIGGLGIVILALFLILFMPENNFRPALAGERGSWQQMGQTFKQGVQVIRGSHILTIMMAIGLIYGLSSEGLDRLWEAHLLANFVFPSEGILEPVVWFGIINMVQITLTIVFTELIRRYVKVENQLVAVSLLLILNILIVAGLVVFGLAPNFVIAVGSIWMVFSLRRTGAPLYSAWLNKGLKSEIRATVLSMRGQLDAIGQLIGGPIIGIIALQAGLRAGMIGVGLMLFPAVVLYGQALRLLNQNGETDSGS